MLCTQRVLVKCLLKWSDPEWENVGTKVLRTQNFLTRSMAAWVRALERSRGTLYGNSSIFRFWIQTHDCMIETERKEETIFIDILSLGRVSSVNCCKMYKLCGGLILHTFLLENVFFSGEVVHIGLLFLLKHTWKGNKKGSLKLTRQVNLGGKWF